ncbi:MFS transporter [Frankia sp. CN7]|nr:MFS transporter [Frankia nepalensis]
MFVVFGLLSGAGGVLFPAQIDDYQVDKATIGLTFFTSAGGYVAASVLSGPSVARFGGRLVVLVAGLGLGAAGLATAARPLFAAFVLVQALGGYAVGTLESVMNAYLATQPNATSLLNRLHAFFGVGALLGPLLATWLLTLGGWQVVVLVLTIAGFGPMAVAVAGYPDRADDPLLVHAGSEAPGTAVSGTAMSDTAMPGAAMPGAAVSGAGASGTELAAGTTAAGTAASREGLGSVLRTRPVLLGALLLAAYVGLEISVGTWGFSYLVEHHALSDPIAGYAISGYWLGLTAGRFLIGPVTARLRLTEPGLLWGSLAGTAAACALAWAALASAGLTIAAFVLLGFFLGPIFPTMIALTPRLTTARLVATAIGVINAGALLGGAVLPWLAGTLLQEAGPQTLLPFAFALGAVQLVVWRVLARRLAPGPALAGVAVVPGPAPQPAPEPVRPAARR